MQRKFFSGPQVLFLVMIILTLVSCNKGKPTTPVHQHPQMEYFNLDNREIKENSPGFSIDVNHDGRKDLLLATVLVGDPIYQVDKLQFLITSGIAVNLPVNDKEEIPVMSSGDLIALQDFSEYHWFELSSILLIQKVTSFTQPVVWEGHWRDARHKYLPYQVIENDKRYNGWIELSVDIDDGKVVLHKAAISKEPNKVVKAGE